MSRHSYRRREKALSNAELRVIGMGLRPLAHELAAEYRRLVGEDYFDRAFVQSEDFFTERFHVPVSVRLLGSTVALLLTLPRPGRGRPRKPSTEAALKLAEEIKSVRKVANLIAATTGEPPDQIRSRLKGVKRRSKKSG